MKLFSPTKAKEAHSGKRDDDISQIAYLSVTLKKLQDSINLENTNFSKRMTEQRELYNEEKVKLQAELKDLQAKLAKGEKELIKLLIPVDGLKERAEETLSNSQQQALSIMAREEELIELKEALTEKIDSLTEREIEVAEKEISIDSRLKGIEKETEMVSDGHKRLNEEKERFILESTTKEKVLAEKESAIIIIEKRNKEYLESRTKELNDQEKSLRDRREALDRAFKEVEKLKEKYNK